MIDGFDLTLAFAALDTDLKGMESTVQQLTSDLQDVTKQLDQEREKAEQLRETLEQYMPPFQVGEVIRRSGWQHHSQVRGIERAFGKWVVLYGDKGDDNPDTWDVEFAALMEKVAADE